MSKPEIILRANDIRKDFRDGPVLRGVNLTLEGGSITVLMGRSGAGKSTLIRALSLIDPPESGTIEILGRSWSYPASRAQSPAPWPDVSVVFQDLFLWPHLSVEGNLLIPALKRHGNAAKKRVSETAAELGISRLLGRRPQQLSRGQRQLVALGRAVVLAPTALFLDEVTASLDLETAATVGDVLKRIKGDGAAILLITHQLDFARSQADYFALMDDGNIVEAGPTTILDQPTSVELKHYLGLARRAP